MESQTLEFVSVPYGIKHIGQNAFKTCRNLKSIILPSTIEEFGEGSFSECRDLKNIRIANYELSEQRYLELKEASKCANGSVFVARVFPDDKLFKGVARAALTGTANFIQDGIPRLFTYENLNYNEGHYFFKKMSCYGFDDKVSYIYENDSMQEMIREKNFGFMDIVSESKNDQFVKDEITPQIKKTAIFTFDDSKTKYEDGKYFILADISIGYHFWQSVVPVVVDGKNYYIYRRNFLSSSSEMDYIRSDVSVYTDKGSFASEEEGRIANAKYRLLSIL